MLQLTHSQAEMSNSPGRIFMHEVEYSLALLDLADDRRAAFSIVVVGNQIDASMFVKAFFGRDFRRVDGCC
jgi:hypothetical protein